MIETTDILYMVLAFCALWVTAFVCWFFYQLAMVLKRANDLISELRWQAERIEQAIHGVKTKFEDGSEHLGRLTDHVKSFVGKKSK